MAIHPIDLQTMYSQIDNVAKQVVHQQQGAALAESVQQTNFVRQNKERHLPKFLQPKVHCKLQPHIPYQTDG